MFSNLNWILFVSQKAFSARAAAGGLKQGTPLGSLEGDLDPRPITRHWAGTTSTAVGGRGCLTGNQDSAGPLHSWEALLSHF